MTIHKYIYTVERRKKTITDININTHKYKQTHTIRTLNTINILTYYLFQ